MMKTKYFWMLLVACFLGTQVMNAQDNKSGKREHKRMTMEQMSEMQANKIANQLGLDDAKTAKFKEVYKKYMKELNELRKKDMPQKQDMKKGEPQAPKQMTDAEVDKMMRERFAESRKMLDIREKYYDEFRKFLSPKQVQKVYDQGQMNRGKFHKEMNRRAGMKRQGGKPGNPAPGQPQPQN